jgi:hypothetical protein
MSTNFHATFPGGLMTGKSLEVAAGIEPAYRALQALA